MSLDALEQLSVNDPLIQESLRQASIGSGGFGQIYPIKDYPGLVLKYFIDRPCNQQDSQNKEREEEVKILKKLTHRKVVRFIGRVLNGDKIVGIIMRFVKNKSLKECIFEPKWSYSMFTVVCWMEHLFSILVYLQQIRLLHRDICPDNILVDHMFNLVLADFGAAKEFVVEADNRATMEGSYVGHVKYRAPEVKFGGDNPEISYASDMYSTGVVCWEMIERRHLFEKDRVFDNEEFRCEFQAKKDLAKMEKLTCYPYLKELIFGCVRFEAAERTKALHALAEVTLHKKVLYEKLKKELPFRPMHDESEKVIKQPQEPTFQEDEHRVNQVNWEQEDLGLHEFLDNLVISEDVDELAMQRKLIDRESIAHLSRFAVLQFWTATNLYLPYYHIDFREFCPTKVLQQSTAKAKSQEKSQEETGKPKEKGKVRWWTRLPVVSPHQVAKTCEMLKCFVSPQIFTTISESAKPEDFLAKCGDFLATLFAPRLESMKLRFRGWFSERDGQDLPAKGYIFQIIFPPRSICGHRPRCLSDKIMHPLWNSPRLSLACPSCCDQQFPEYAELYFELVDFFFKIRHLTELSQLVRAVAQMAYLRNLCTVISCSKVFLFKRVTKNSKSFLVLTSLSIVNDEIVLCMDEKLEMFPFDLQTATEIETCELDLLKYLDEKLTQKIFEKFVANYRDDCPLLKELSINKHQLKEHSKLLIEVCTRFLEAKSCKEALEKELKRFREARVSFSIDLLAELFQKLTGSNPESRVQFESFSEMLRLEDSMEWLIGKAVFERGFEVKITDFPNLFTIIERPLSLMKAKGVLDNEKRKRKRKRKISSLINWRNVFTCVLFAIGAVLLYQRI